MKSLHGQYILRSRNAGVAQTTTHHGMRNAGLKSETEGTILVEQNQNLFTKRKPNKTKQQKNLL